MGFSATLHGAAAQLPHRRISGIASPRAISVDVARDVAYIACQGGTLRVFAGVSALDGSVPATVVLSGDLTGLGLYTCGVTVDTLRDEVYVAVGVPENRVNVFPGASGLKGALNLEPARKLEGSATLFNGPTGLFFHRP